ncbi:hypothetical protein CHH55_06065 [Niallia circulans]|uniref:hypothetical protein n=1 Tax=Niallia TaxID=2837506 RepID=UPI00069F5CCC|nr:hypothetical protein [Niallia circulans]MCM2982643.1 hypothetical protein [Niallia circulans]MDR4316080.1 hypothetical protein [Niallia circulans]MED3837581.1 hypothetical protein [Niallia circulans]MED4244651.1 hypothetical protein [Niallia circulans]MED4249865.1 hypothetical protein [Niallia circulans]
MEDLKEEFYDEKDNEKIEEEETAIDHFSMFMFGTNRQSVRKKQQVEHFQHNDKQPSYSRREKGDDWILGRSGGKTQQVEEKDENVNIDAVANFLNQIDLELLIKNVDLLMTSANDLKPIFKKITPFIKKWMD